MNNKQTATEERIRELIGEKRFFVIGKRAFKPVYTLEDVLEAYFKIKKHELWNWEDDRVYHEANESFFYRMKKSNVRWTPNKSLSRQSKEVQDFITGVLFPKTNK